MLTTQEQIRNLNEWAKALESGKYPQTRGVLHDKDGYCCLGVLCDISRHGEWEPHRVLDEGQFEFVADGESYFSSAPVSVLHSVGLDENEGLGTRLDDKPWIEHDGDEIHVLADLNDHEEYGMGFPEIAALLRRYAAELAEGVVAG